MSGLPSALKRLVVGRKFASERLSRERLPVRLALPTFAADALSSVAYAPDEILLTLALAGVGAYAVSPWVALAVVGLMLVVVLTGRNNVHEYPDGGGDYEVVRRNLGGGAARVAGSALLVDYVLTVAVSISQASVYATGALPGLEGHEMVIALVLIGLLAVLNLRGVKESGKLLAVPVYLFMASVGVTVLVGAVQAARGHLGDAPSAHFSLIPGPGFESGLTAVGAAFLVLRAFSSGCAALTGVEAVGNGVPSFRPPKSRNAATTLVLLGVISSAMILGIIALARATGVQYVQEPAQQLLENGHAPTGYQQLPVLGQIAQAVFSSGSLMFYLITAATGIVLFLAAHTAFNGFPNLASVLAGAGFLPRQLRVRGDRLAYSNGIIALALAAMVLVWAVDARVTLLIQMYIVGVFVAFSLSQLGMIRHFTRKRRVEIRAAERRRLAVRRFGNCIGFALVTTVLVIVLVTKFVQGAWVALLMMGLLWVLMTAVHHHYRTVREELSLGEDPQDPSVHPSRSHALVLVTSLDRPTLRALAVASATHHSTLQALAVSDEENDPRELAERWRAAQLQVPLRIVYSPYREFARPMLAYVMTVLSRNPRDVVVVYIPQFLVGHWWEAILHNHSTRRLATRLSHFPRVVVATVPWQLGSAQDLAGQVRDEARTSTFEKR